MDIIYKCTDEEEHESVHKIVVDSLVKNTAKDIQVGSISDIDKILVAYNTVHMVSSKHPKTDKKTNFTVNFLR